MGEILQKAEHVPEALVELVVDATDGNPFYIEELVNGCSRPVSSRRTATAGRSTSRRSIAVPATLRGVLQARLDTLTRRAPALQQAAVIGRVFWDEAVEVLAGSGEQGARGNVARSAPSREVVYERRRSTFDDTREFLFKHALLRDDL